MFESVVLFLVVFTLMAGVAMKIFKWVEDGGLYYMKNPAAKVMDDAKERGEAVDYKTALKIAVSVKNGE